MLEFWEQKRNEETCQGSNRKDPYREFQRKLEDFLHVVRALLDGVEEIPGRTDYIMQGESLLRLSVIATTPQLQHPATTFL